ncbi:hypothetical protein CONLIGDRAFT_377096 [Coniochaeta ligniaria NRRL 30616]|uniref:Uncharacterized protein n=1 Tax=Coniochaeta ligniaria NRRL 30616 TaxID=1408157 RepID=A0A1J7IM21_9PEZI|nr:hypothetical protein CONLIGDRAFT_377096 [Coniochaeta ligniaria NRRL 30616]
MRKHLLLSFVLFASRGTKRCGNVGLLTISIVEVGMQLTHLKCCLMQYAWPAGLFSYSYIMFANSIILCSSHPVKEVLDRVITSMLGILTERRKCFPNLLFTRRTRPDSKYLELWRRCILMILRLLGSKQHVARGRVPCLQTLNSHQFRCDIARTPRYS